MSGLSAKDRTRSPRFPSQPLSESLKHARLIYEGVHRSSIDSHTAFRIMGFSGKSGSSAKALGALRQYGLIEGMGERTRISDLALAILEPASEAERSEAIRTAARAPAVFAAIIERFEERVPSSDEPIRAFLIRDLGFQKSSADDCIRSLRLSLDLAEQQSREPEEPHMAKTEASFEERDHTGVPEAPRLPEHQPTQSVSIPLSKECRAELQIYGEITDRVIQNLIRQMQFLSEVWAE